MKAIQITKPGEFVYTEVSKPVPGPSEVLIKVAAAGICGTDLHIFHGEYEATYPIIPGHEFSGTVAEIGPGVKYFQPGDRVTADPNSPCNICPFCQRGEFNQCVDLQAVGVTRDGAMAEFVIVPEGLVFPIGDLSLSAAAMVEPLACVVWGLKRVQVQAGDAALVFGAGPMGCLVSQALRSAGAAQVMVTDVVEWRLEIAKNLGATDTLLGPRAEDQIHGLNPTGFQIVVDATGIGKVLEDAFQFVRPRGKVWVFGVVPPDQKINIVPYDIFRKDISIIGSFAVNQTFHEAIALIQSGAVQVDPLISHQLPLEQFGKALQLAENDPKRMKVQVTM
jgi:D-arabinitol dehydrogenase (NADP+)